METNWKKLARELARRMQTDTDVLAVEISADEEGGCIDVAPGPGATGVVKVEEVVLFAQYHGLSVMTALYQSGPGLIIL
jgi:hypothetical protein